MLVAYDLTRLFLGPLSPTPRGVDRVDVMLARRFFPHSRSANLGVLMTPWGLRIFKADRVVRGLDYLADLWGESGPKDDRALLNWLKERFAGKPYRRNPVVTRRLSLAAKAARMAGMLRATGIVLGENVVEKLPPGAVYINIGQIGLAVPALFRWLERRPDVTAALMLHDVIPLDMPGQVEPSSVNHHRRMVRTVARHADALITTTEHAHQQVVASLESFGCPDIPTFTRGLPLDDAFRTEREAPAWLRSKDYFVVCSTVEPRKNHALLFDAWERLSGRLGEATPHLVVIGGRGFKADAILARSEGPALRSHIHHVSGMSTRTLVSVLKGARALLSPSLAEGFGLPVLEARALGVPIIASDIASHREIAGDGALLLDPQRLEPWIKAIEARLAAARTTPAPVVSSQFNALAYCEALEEFLGECALKRRSVVSDKPAIMRFGRDHRPEGAGLISARKAKLGYDSGSTASNRPSRQREPAGQSRATGPGLHSKPPARVVDA